MFRSLNELYNGLVRQEKINKLYEAVLVGSFDLRIDFTELLKELNELDKSLRSEEKDKKPQPEKKEDIKK